MTIRFVAGALAAATFAGAAIGQTAPKTGAADTGAQSLTRAELAQKVDAEFKGLDTNSDGKISKAEVEAALAKRTAETEAALKGRQEEEFRKLDTDKNGQLSLAEFQAAMTIQPKAGVADQRLKELDLNKDGTISGAEFRSPMLARFDRMDTNKDGKISEAEVRAANNQAAAGKK